MKKTVFPAPLNKGNIIGIMAPSSRVDKDILSQAERLIEKRGFQVYIHPQTYLKNHQSAGTPEQKAAAFHDLIAEKDISAIFCARGGNGAGMMLEHLDFKLIAKNPKIIMGYSDVTALLNAIYKKTGIVGFHGPMGHGLIKQPKKQIDQCFAMLSGEFAALDMPKVTILKRGKASGTLLGGNLSVLCSLLGTPYAPNFNGAILFIEDVGEEMSRIDRNLRHLRNAGIFKQLTGLIVGSFTDIQDKGKTPYGFSLKECILNATDGIDIPVLLNAPLGHGKDLYTLPVGAIARLNGTALSFPS